MIRNVKKPFFLAGGISAENVLDAIEQVHPYGIDASSSLETDGVKDRDKIKVFIERIRNHE
jgi:phosphoribosylanthranilate isomerase